MIRTSPPIIQSSLGFTSDVSRRRCQLHRGVRHATEPPSLDPAAKAALTFARDVSPNWTLSGPGTGCSTSACELSAERMTWYRGVLDESRQELARFITAGVDDESRHEIGASPLRSGLAGELIQNPRPLRLEQPDRSPERSRLSLRPSGNDFLLGRAIMVAGQPVGNLYLTDKAAGGEFTEHDEMALTILAEFAGVAIDHAQRYGGLDADRAELQGTVDSLNAALQVSHAVHGTNIDASVGADRGPWPSAQMASRDGRRTRPRRRERSGLSS